MDQILAGFPLEPIAKGVFHRVFRVGGTPFVLKEGRWDPSLPIGAYEVPLPTRMLPGIGGKLLPERDEARRQYEKEYLLLAEYLGMADHGDIEESETYPDFHRLTAAQRRVRSSLPQAVARLEQRYGWRAPKELASLLASDVALHNFLPREYLLWGASHSVANTGRPTSHIVQEFIDGPTLHDASDATVAASPVREQMTLLCVLILFLQSEHSVIPDTRPRQPLWQGSGWLRKTDNVVIGTHGLRFVDTRWLWRLGKNPLARGLVIPELVTRSCLSTIGELCG
jgi:hypothetical protein